MGIGAGPWNVFLNPIVDGTENLLWAVPKEDRPSTNGNIPPYPGLGHGSHNLSTTFTMRASTTIFIGFDPQVELSISKFELEVTN